MKVRVKKINVPVKTILVTLGDKSPFRDKTDKCERIGYRSTASRMADVITSGFRLMKTRDELYDTNAEDLRDLPSVPVFPRHQPPDIADLQSWYLMYREKRREIEQRRAERLRESPPDSVAPTPEPSPSSDPPVSDVPSATK